MQLVESYLLEIGRFLPQEQRDDIVVELRSTLEEQISEVAGTGSPTLEDQKSVLNRFGHPLKVAGEYQEPKYLIGPVLFPVFMDTLKIALSIIIPVVIAVFALSWVALDIDPNVRLLFKALWSAALWSVPIITAVFIALEYSGEKLSLYEKWSADSLSLTSRATVKRSDIVTNLLTEGIFLLWWNDVVRFQNWLPGFGEQYSISLTEAWPALYWPLNLLAGAWFLVHLFVLVRGLWSRPTLQLEIALGFAALIACGWLLINQPLVHLSGDVGANGLRILNRSVMTVVIAIAGLIAWDTYQAMKRMKRVRPVETQRMQNESR